MAKGELGHDLIAVATPISLAQDIALLNQLGEDFVGASLGNTDRSSYVAQSNTGIISNTEQDVSVVGEEIPTGRDLACVFCYLLQYS